MRALAFVIAGSLVGSIVAATVPADAQTSTPRGVGWKNERPAIILGDDLYVSLRTRLVLDARGFDRDLDEDTYRLDVARIGLKGALTRHLDFEIEREIDDDGEWQDWKDVYLNWGTFDRFAVRAGTTFTSTGSRTAPVTRSSPGTKTAPYRARRSPSPCATTRTFWCAR